MNSLSRSCCLVLAALSCATLLTAAVPPRRVDAQEMQYPVDVAVGPDAVVYVADRNYHGIWKLAAGKPEKFSAGTAKIGTPLNAVRCVAFDHEGKLLAGDSATREVYRFDDTGKPTPLTKGKIGIPLAIAVRKSGEILVSDQELQCIWKVPAEGGEPVKLAVVAGVVGIALDKEDRLWVSSRSQHQVRRVSPDGKVERVVSDRPFRFPQHIVVDDNNVVYVADSYAKAIWKIEDGKKPVKFVEGAPLVNPVGLAVQGDKILVADSRANAIFQIDSAGKISKLAPKS